MNRITLAALFILVIALIVSIHWLSIDPEAPSFRPVRGSKLQLPAYSEIDYNFLSPSPFEDGKMWIHTWSGTNGRHCFLYGIDQKRTLGELVKGEPVFMNRDQSSLLCAQRGPAGPSQVGEQITRFLSSISGGKIRFAHVPNDAEVFWILDLKRNSTTRIGSLSQVRGAGSSFQPSPGFRFGFNKPSASSQRPEFFLCDLERKSFRSVALNGWPVGWWSDTEIIVKDPANDFVLWDVLSEKRSPLLSSAEIGEFLEAAQIPDADPKRANLFSIWDGKQNNFYLTDTHKKWQATNSYLIKLKRPDAALKLIAREFKFEWSDHLDPTGTFYLFTGREPGDRSTGVFLRDLKEDTTRILVVPDDSRYFSLPRFYNGGVIYRRTNMLWWTDFSAPTRAVCFPRQRPACRSVL